MGLVHKQDSPTPTPRRWPRRHSLFRASSRSTRWLRVVLLLAFVVGVFHCIEKFKFSRAALLVKYTPTSFTQLTLEEQAALANPRWQWADYDSLDGRSLYELYSRQRLLADRGRWSKLGGGWEGDTFRYGDNAVKVYKQHRAPFRNCVPDWVPELRWPTEIPASVLLGGMSENESVSEDAIFLPVTDYFLSPTLGDDAPQWHFITPFQPNGNAKGLTKRLLADQQQYTARDLDIVFRPSFERILFALGSMHTDHDLCHDDVKLDNIFLGSSGRSDSGEKLQPNETTHWLLGDLGNAREKDHPYHASTMWLSLKQNLPDCRANDVYRLAKVYMQFLRWSVADVTKFDQEFFAAAEPWSRLFWSISDAVHAGEFPTAASTLERSVTDFSPRSAPIETIRRQPAGLSNRITELLLGRWLILSKATRDAIVVSASEKFARLWGLVGLLGVPRESCAAGAS